MNNNDNTLISLRFLINGKEKIISNINVNEPLKAAVERALNQSGNTGVPISEWIVQWNGTNLDLNKRIKDFNFPDNVLISVVQRAGVVG